MLRIDDTDPTRTVDGGEAAILADLDWLGIGWDEGPVLQSERGGPLRRGGRNCARERSRARRRRLRQARRRHAPAPGRDSDVPARHRRRRSRARDHAGAPRVRPPAERAHPAPHRAGTRRRAPRGDPPRAPGRRRREEAVEAARRGVRRRPAGGRASRAPRCAPTSRSSTSRRTTCGSIAPGSAGSRSTRSPRCRTRSSRRRRKPRSSTSRALRGAQDAGRGAGDRQADPRSRAGIELPAEAGPTLERFVELRASAGTLDEEGARSIVRELKAVGGDLRALRLALTGAPRGPELWTVVAALPRDESLERVRRSQSSS